MSRELVDPTPALDLIVQQAIRPRMVYLCTLVGELMARPVDDVRVTRCAHSIHAQCVAFIPNPVAARLYPGRQDDAGRGGGARRAHRLVLAGGDPRDAAARRERKHERPP